MTIQNSHNIMRILTNSAAGVDIPSRSAPAGR
jgi:hypothetical protein